MDLAFRHTQAHVCTLIMCVCVGVDVKGAVGGKNHTHTQSHHTFKCASGAREDKTGEYDIMNDVTKEACSMYR